MIDFLLAFDPLFLSYVISSIFSQALGLHMKRIETAIRSCSIPWETLGNARYCGSKSISQDSELWVQVENIP